MKVQLVSPESINVFSTSSFLDSRKDAMYKDQDGILIDAYQVTAERYYMSLNVGKRGLALAKIGDWITHTFGLPENESFLYSDITFKEKFTLLFPPMDPNIIHIYHAVDKAELTN